MSNTSKITCLLSLAAYAAASLPGTGDDSNIPGAGDNSGGSNSGPPGSSSTVPRTTPPSSPPSSPGTTDPAAADHGFHPFRKAIQDLQKAWAGAQQLWKDGKQDVSKLEQVTGKLKVLMQDLKNKDFNKLLDDAGLAGSTDLFDTHWMKKTISRQTKR